MADNDLNEMVEEVVQDSDVITVPIDDTLTNSGEAADAKAVGDALALKADKSEIQTAVKVNGQSADAQGLILVNGTHIPMTSSDATTVKEAIDAAGNRTADEILMSSAQDAQTVAAAIGDAASRTAAQIPMSGGDLTTVGQKIGWMEEDLEDLQTTVAGLDEKTAADIPYSAGGTETIKEHVDSIAAVKSVNDIHPDDNGNVDLQIVPYAENLHSDTMQEIDDTFLIRTTAGEGSVSDGEAWALKIMGNRVHNGYVAESLQLQVIPMPRSAPAAITASINQATFLTKVGNQTGTYTFNYASGWKLNSTSVTISEYGITVTNDPVNDDQIVVVVTGSGSSYTASMTVNAVPRTAPPEITATIDRDTFVAYVDQSSTILLTYTTEWSANPALYGITVTNDPIAGDQIKVVYVKEERGEIVVAEPTELVGTGWNLYDHTNGYARVVKYDYLYKIGGTYTSIAFADTPEGTTTAITPDLNGLFDLPSGKTMGYIIVSGGNGTNTYITCAWTDWTSGYSGDWQAYSETSIDLSSVYGEGKLEHGLLRAGDVRDEIDLNMKRCYSRIERIAYTDQARAAAEASGLAYEFDEDYIYIEKATPDVFAISLTEEYTVSEHGLEWFDGSVGVYAEILYGQNLKDKLKRDVLTISEQTLTAGEKAQVQSNLNVPDVSSVAALADGLGVVANGNTHAAIAAGEYVYVRNHGTLAEGLYTANAAIAQNETLTTSNLTADAKGGLNALNGKITNKQITLTSISNNLNNAKSPGIVMYTNGEAATLTNAPYADLGGYVVVYKVADNEIIQTYYQRNTSGAARIKTRLCLSGDWTIWREHEAMLSLTSTQKLLTVADNDTLCPTGTTLVLLYNGDSSDLPSSSYKYGFATVEKYSTHRIVVTVKSVVIGTTVAINRMQTDGVWGGWELVPKKSDIVTDSTSLSSKTASANSLVTWSVSVSKTGYTPIGILSVDFSDNNIALCKYSISGTTAYVNALNIASASKTTTGSIVVLYKAT